MKIDQKSKKWEVKKFEDLLEYIQTTPYIVESTEYSNDYQTPVLTAGKSFILGKTNEQVGIFDSLPVIIFDDFTTASKFVDFPFKVKSSAMKILKAKDEAVNIKFVYYYMQTVRITYDTHKRYWISVFSKLPVPSPPLAVQEETVSKIEELFSEIDKGVEELKTAQQQLKVYRQAVMKWAFEGKLTEEWRKENELKISIHSGSQKVVGTGGEQLAMVAEEEVGYGGGLPKGWTWVDLQSLGELARGKSKHRPRNDRKLFGGAYPFIQTGEVKAAGHTIKSFETTYSDVGLQQSKLWKKGTLCITIAANIAEVAFLGFDGCFPDSIVGFTVNEDKVLANYIYYFFKANQSRLEAFAPATAQKNINLNTLESLILPFCSLTEQGQIVEEIESRLSVCDKIEETISDSLRQAEALRQSVLKKAFEGRLV